MIKMRTFVLIAYFFVACFLTHQQLIHEVSLTLANGYFKTSKEKKTCCQTTVLYIFYNLGEFFPGYFRCFTIKDFIILKSFFQIFLKELSKWLAIQSQIIWCKDFVILCDPFTSFVFIIWGSLNPQILPFVMMMICNWGLKNSMDFLILKSW